MYVPKQSKDDGKIHSDASGIQDDKLEVSGEQRLALFSGSERCIYVIPSNYPISAFVSLMN